MVLPVVTLLAALTYRAPDVLVRIGGIKRAGAPMWFAWNMEPAWASLFVSTVTLTFAVPLEKFHIEFGFAMVFGFV